MKVGVDARGLLGGRGIARYATGLLAALMRRFPEDEYRMLTHGPSAGGKTALLTAIAIELQRTRPHLPLAFITGDDFSAELIAAISRNQVDSWRARYRRARMFILDDVEPLLDTVDRTG